MQSPTVHPEIEQLRHRCSELRSLLRAAAEEWHAVSVVERRQLLDKYDEQFGALERERQDVALENAIVFRKVELLTIKASRGEEITKETIELVEAIVSKQYETDVKPGKLTPNPLSQARGGEGGEFSKRGEFSKEIDQEEDRIKRMFREIAKKLHPDIIGEHIDLNPMWHTVQRAYKTKDERQMRSLLAIIGAEEPDRSVTEQWDVERWQREEKMLATQLRVEERKLMRLKKEEPFSIANVLSDEAWIEKHRHELETDVAERKRTLQENIIRYEELTGGTHGVQH